MVQGLRWFNILSANNTIHFLPFPTGTWGASFQILDRRGGHWKNAQSHIFLKQPRDTFKKGSVEIFVIILQCANQYRDSSSKMNARLGEPVNECRHLVELALAK